jgi:hypothetical protein
MKGKSPVKFGLKLVLMMLEKDVRKNIYVTIVDYNYFYYVIEEDTREKGKLYKPQARGNADSFDKGDDLSRFMGERKTERILTKKKKEGEKKKSNLELFKEELKMYLKTIYRNFTFYIYFLNIQIIDYKNLFK